MGRTKKTNLPTSTRKLRSSNAIKPVMDDHLSQECLVNVQSEHTGRRRRKHARLPGNVNDNVNTDVQSQISNEGTTVSDTFPSDTQSDLVIDDDNLQPCIESSKQDVIQPSITFNTVEEDEDVIIDCCVQLQPCVEEENSVLSQSVAVEVKESCSSNNESCFSKESKAEEDRICIVNRYQESGDTSKTNLSDEVPHAYVEEVKSICDANSKEEDVTLIKEDADMGDSDSTDKDNGLKASDGKEDEKNDISMDDVEVEIIREDSPSFSPPPSPPKSVEKVIGDDQASDTKIPIISNVSSLSTLEIKSLNVNTQFTLSKPQLTANIGSTEILNKQPDHHQVKSGHSNASVIDEPLDYVEEVRINNSVQLMSSEDQSKFDQTLKDSMPVVSVIPTKTPTCIIHIRNLVRPFQIAQLKSMLCKEDLIIESSFWIDQIKSHCFVTYESADAANRARERLHGVCWPSGSPKTLDVNFSSAAELEFFLNNSKSLQEFPSHRINDTSRPVVNQALPDKAIMLVDPPAKKVAIREWDIPKLEKHKMLENTKDAGREELVTDAKKPVKEFKKQENGKLLDDLFRKTTTKPCIYWLPLTEEQVKRKRQKEEIRRSVKPFPNKNMYDPRLHRSGRRSPPPPPRRRYDDRNRRSSNSRRSLSRHRRRHRSRSAHAVR